VSLESSSVLCDEVSGYSWQFVTAFHEEGEGLMLCK
jgi:hypothetical protein